LKRVAAEIGRPGARPQADGIEDAYARGAEKTGLTSKVQRRMPKKKEFETSKIEIRNSRAKPAVIGFTRPVALAKNHDD